jgi:hypothetical protein
MPATDRLAPFRPPAVPLVTHDPYFSTWSFTDNLYQDWTKHWTGFGRGLVGLISVDGVVKRFLGIYPHGLPPLPQIECTVLPTRTIYRFADERIELELTFMTPALPHDLDLLSRPVTYITFAFRSLDGAAHDLRLYFDVSGDWAVNMEEAISWGRFHLDGMQVMRIGSQEQPVLRKSGDNLRIDWGHLYLAVPPRYAAQTCMTDFRSGRDGFATELCLPKRDDMRMPRLASDQWPVLCTLFPIALEAEATVERHVMLAFDDGFAIEYMHRRLRPYWRRANIEIDDLLLRCDQDYAQLRTHCAAFDEELMADLRATGGERYARLCALSFRQCLAGHKLAVDADGTALFFSKENFSNGCIATVDVIYPAAPIFLLLSPTLLVAQLVPILDYARSPRWRFPFAPHDLGIYPLANGQIYGGGERSETDQMPVEECGNMLILVAALTIFADDDHLARRYWELLIGWADYLVGHGIDPGRQLCTDDFTGHLAHNANLAIKAVVAIGAFAQLCSRLGEAERARRYRAVAEEMVGHWLSMAEDGDHYRLVFDQSGTWSQKYNLIWDHLLGLDLFPPEVAAKEIAFYRRQQNQYGLPLDSRHAYTKLDWIFWTACLSDDPQDFRFFTDPVYEWAHQTASRVPLTDWYGTTDGKQCGFQARTVVGGIYLRLLQDEEIWRKWSQRARIAEASVPAGAPAQLAAAARS